MNFRGGYWGIVGEDFRDSSTWLDSPQLPELPESPDLPHCGAEFHIHFQWF